MWYFDKKNKPTASPVYVHWHDIETKGSSEWSDVEEMEEWVTAPMVEFHTCGFLVYEDEHYLVIAETLGSEACSAMTKIPKGIIIRRVDLNIPN